MMLEPRWWVPVLLLGMHVASRTWYDEDFLRRLPWSGRVAVVTGAVLLVLLAAPEQRPFIYFQF